MFRHRLIEVFKIVCLNSGLSKNFDYCNWCMYFFMIEMINFKESLHAII